MVSPSLSTVFIDQNRLVCDPMNNVINSGRHFTDIWIARKYLIHRDVCAGAAYEKGVNANEAQRLLRDFLARVRKKS